MKYEESGIGKKWVLAWFPGRCKIWQQISEVESTIKCKTEQFFLREKPGTKRGTLAL